MKRLTFFELHLQNKSRSLGLNKIDSIFYWSDSTTMLYWIKRNSNCLDQFVTYRIGDILGFANVEDWHWTLSKINRTDIATCSYDEHILNFKGCFSGPTFLREDWSTWPKRTIPDIEDKNKEITIMNTLLEFHSPMLPNIRIAWFLRIGKIWISKSRQYQRPGHVTMDDLKKTILVWIQQCQIESFMEEIEPFQQGRGSRQSKL